MITIKDTPFDNYYGEGKQKEIIDTDTGKRYIIKNTPFKNYYGDGYQQEIVEEEDYKYHGTPYSLMDPEEKKKARSEMWQGLGYIIAFLMGFMMLTMIGGLHKPIRSGNVWYMRHNRQYCISASCVEKC